MSGLMDKKRGVAVVYSDLSEVLNGASRFS